MAATETTESAHQVTIEDAGPAKKKLTITIPAELVDEKLNDSFSTLTAEAALPGFRKGRAPRQLVERRFGSNVLTETRNQLVADAYSKAIEDNDLRTVGEPEGDELEDIEVKPGEALTFTIEVEVQPEFELPKLEGVKVKKPLVEVSEQHLDDEMLRQTYKNGEAQELEGTVAEGDRLLGHAVAVTEDDEQISDLPEAVIAMPLTREEPKGHILGLFVEDMFKVFDGKKTGDVVAYKTTMPESDERASLRGKKVTVEFTIDKGMHVIPAETSQVIEVYGMSDEDELRDEIRTALQQRAEQEQQASMREQVSEYLADNTEFELPEKLSSTQAQRTLDRQRVELLYRGVPVDEVETRMAEIKTESEESSHQRLKLFFVLNKLAEHFDVQVAEQEINGRIAMMAAQRGERPERLRAQLRSENRLQQIAMQIREHKALDRVVDTAEVKEISAEEWNKMVEKRAEDKKKA